MTPAPERDHFEGLLRGHATASLTAQERKALATLCATSTQRAAAVSGFDEVHARFAAERGLRAAVLTPVEACEEADESFARLAATTARAEAELRGRLQHAATTSPLAPQLQPGLQPEPQLRPARQVWGRAAFALAALAAAALVAALLGAFAAPPALLTNKPSDAVAGRPVASIVIAPRLSLADRALSWSPVWHAHGYEVVIIDGAGNVVLRRSPEQAKSTRWELTTTEFARVRGSSEVLRLRVRALDGLGLSIATSGDLPLAIE